MDEAATDSEAAGWNLVATQQPSIEMNGWRSAQWFRLLFADPFRDEDAMVRAWDLILFALGYSGMVLMIAELEVAYDPITHTRIVSSSTEVMRLIIMLSTLILLFLLAFYYRLLQGIENRRWRDQSGSCWRFLYRRPLAPYFWAEVVVCMIHPTPLVDLVWGTLFSDKLGLLMLFRLYLGLRVIRDFSEVYILRERLSRAPYFRYTGAPDISTRTCIKLLFAKRPALFATLASGLMFFVVTYTIYVCERDDPEADLSFGEAAWFTVVSMTSTGYGDFVPKSLWGKVFASIAMIVGVMISSLYIAMVYRFLELTPPQIFALEWVEQNRHIGLERELAARVIQLHWRNHQKRLSIPPELMTQERRAALNSDLRAQLQPVLQQIQPLRYYRKYTAEHSRNPVLYQMGSLNRRLDKMERRELRHNAQLERLLLEIQRAINKS